MAEMGPGMPVDMDAVDEVAQTATQGSDGIDEVLERFQGALGSGHRVANFAHGTGEARANGRGLRAIAEAIPEV